MALKAAQKAADASANLIVVTGERGEPQPQEWKLIFNDPAARGGIREIVASGDVIVSQRTPLKGYTATRHQPSIALTRLNLDSDRAFEIANKQAIARRIGFSWVDYTLRANAAGGAPMWILRLHDSMGIKVGVIQISAEDGSVIMPLEAAEPPPAESVEQFSDSPTGKKNRRRPRQGWRNARRCREYRERQNASDRGNGSGIFNRRTDHWTKR